MIQPSCFIDPIILSMYVYLKRNYMVLNKHQDPDFDKFIMHLLHLDFICRKTDPSLFTLQTHKGKIFLLLYVDDIIVIGSNSFHVLELVLKV